MSYASSQELKEAHPNDTVIVTETLNRLKDMQEGQDLVTDS